MESKKNQFEIVVKLLAKFAEKLKIKERFKHLFTAKAEEHLAINHMVIHRAARLELLVQ